MIGLPRVFQPHITFSSITLPLDDQLQAIGLFQVTNFYNFILGVNFISVSLSTAMAFQSTIRFMLNKRNSANLDLLLPLWITMGSPDY